MTDVERDAEKTRKRIADLHAHLGSDAEAENARRKLLVLLPENGKTWNLLTLTIQDGFEELAQLSPDDLGQHAFASFAQLLSSPDDVTAVIDAHEQVGADDATASAEARQQIKTSLERYGLNWTDLTNLLRHSMEQLEDWQPNLLDALCDVMHEYVTFKRQPHDAVATALWMLHTFVYDRFMHTPRYGAFSYEPQSGKSVVVSQLMGELTNDPRKYVADKHVAASLYYTMHHERPTVLLDEAQNAEVVGTLKSIINGGFDKSLGGIPRRQGKGGAPIAYNVNAPLAFGWNKGSAAAPLPLDTLSRCIQVDYEKRPRKRRYNMHDVEQQQEFAALRQRIFNWAMASLPILDDDPPIPEELGYGRIDDCWRPLLSIADSLGRAEIAREAAIALSKRRMDESIRVRLLRDIRAVFDLLGSDRIKTEDLLSELRALEECSLENGELWNYWTGITGRQQPHALKKNEMTALLRTFPIHVKTVWPAEPRTSETKSFPGYLREWFEPYWAQYCPDGNTSTQPHKMKHLRLVGDNT
jgi:Protein of unknown function (DUF3631)